MLASLSAYIDMKILYEDKYVIAVEKWPGASSQESPDENCLPRLLSDYRKSKGEDAYIGVVHRLDRVTGGVIVYAKTPKMTAALSGIEYKKEYLAVVNGAPEEDFGTYIDFLYHDRQKNKSFVVKSDRNGAKRAELNFHTLAKVGEHALIRVLLVTGRTHQIRVQFASRGMPIVYDGRYGSREKGNGIALHASRLEFTHPITHKTITCNSRPDVQTAPWGEFSEYIL